MAAGEALHVLDHPAEVNSVDAQGKLLVTGCNDGKVRIYTKFGELQRVLRVHGQMPVYSVKLGEKSIITCGGDKLIRVITFN
jgi:hypothetical protein